jgi:acetyltransferase-like isoleucine patch superfamily enzyme
MLRLAEVAGQELANLNPRLHFAQALAVLLPDEVGGRIRTALLRLAGVRIGAGTIFNGRPSFSGGGDVQRLLRIGSGCWFNVGCRFDVHAPVDIGDGVQFGQEVLLLTHTHSLGSGDRRAGEVKGMPVSIGAGAWIGARAVILPGVRVGQGAVVAAGAVVTRDVGANTIAGGVPAKLLRDLGEEEAAAPQLLPRLPGPIEPERSSD